VTSGVALAVLFVINAGGNASVIARARDATRRQRGADVRRAATRARNRVGTPPVGTWPRATLDDTIDAEIVSEEKWLS